MTRITEPHQVANVIIRPIPIHMMSLHAFSHFAALITRASGVLAFEIFKVNGGMIFLTLESALTLRRIVLRPTTLERIILIRFFVSSPDIQSSTNCQTAIYRHFTRQCREAVIRRTAYLFAGTYSDFVNRTHTFKTDVNDFITNQPAFVV